MTLNPFRYQALPRDSFTWGVRAIAQSLDLTFVWHVQNKRPGVQYCGNLYVDKGIGVFDRRYEFRRLVHDLNQLPITLSAYYFSPSSFEWGVAVTACAHPDATCRDSEIPCDGVTLFSDVRRLSIP